MTEFDCIIIVDGWLGPAAERQFFRLLDAHRKGGIRTGLLSLRGRRTELGWLGADDMIGRLDGNAVAWLDPTEPAAAPLTLILSPELAGILPTAPLRLRTEQAIIWPIEPSLVRTPEGRDGEPLTLSKLAPSVAREIAARLDAPVAWAARTAGERHELAQHAVGLSLTEGVWWPLLDDGRELQNVNRRTARAVGRHWLGDAPLDPAGFGAFAAAFGDCWPMDLAFHGAPAVLESLPAFDQSQGMRLIDGEAQDLDDYLADLALFVAVGDPQADAHLPLAMFQAMQADVVVIAEPAMAAIIDAPLPTAEPPELMGLAASLLSDDIACERARRRQRELIAERHGARAHQARLSPLLQRPQLQRPNLQRNAPAAPALAVHSGQADRVLFVSDDSPHLEHLTRELAIADRLPDRLKPHFVTTARNALLVEKRGFPVEFVAAHNSLPYRDMFEDASAWNYWFERHLAELITFTKARALVFDGVYPFGGVMTNRKRFPDLRFVWIRQPLWRPQARRDALKHGREFDLVIEPGDFAAAFDRGPLAKLRPHVLETAPIRLDEPINRAEARRSLGLGDQDSPAILVDPTLPADKIDSETALMLLNSLAQGGASLWTIDPGGASFGAPWSRSVRRLDDPQAGRLHSGFDGAIAAADYRSLHEHAAAGLPSVLLGGLGSSTDDQAARAAFAEASGFAISLRSGDVYAARAAARKLLDPAARAMMTSALSRHDTANGAGEAALAIADLVFSIGIPQKVGRPEQVGPEQAGNHG